LQTSPFAQLVPALPPEAPHPAVAPQKLRLLRGSTHVPLQFTRPVWHVSAQLPALQTSPGAHAAPTVPTPKLPQPIVAPQKLRFVRGSTHVPLHSTSPCWQETEHEPALQTSPLAQITPAVPPELPHPEVAPQKLRLVSGLTQVPLQFTRPAWHVTAHVPALHTSPDAHAVPAVPASRPQPAVAPQ
jgi:hypothetical protein